MQTALSAKFLHLAFQVAGTTTVPGVSLLQDISAKNSDSDNPPQCQKTPGAGGETAECPTTFEDKIWCKRSAHRVSHSHQGERERI